LRTLLSDLCMDSGQLSTTLKVGLYVHHAVVVFLATTNLVCRVGGISPLRPLAVVVIAGAAVSGGVEVVGVPGFVTTPIEMVPVFSAAIMELVFLVLIGFTANVIAADFVETKAADFVETKAGSAHVRPIQAEVVEFIHYVGPVLVVLFGLSRLAFGVGLGCELGCFDGSK